MKVVFAGCRDYVPSETQLDKIIVEHFFGTLTEIVHGGCRGVDMAVDEWAKNRRIVRKVFSAEWDKYGKVAGPIRNKEMATYSDIAVCFWDGKSPGTRNMVEQMAKARKRVYIYPVEETSEHR